MSSRYLHALLFCSALALGACHTVKDLVPPNLRPPTDTGNALDQAKRRLQQATPCCGSFADFSYATPLPPGPQRFVLGPGSSVVNLNGVRSYFLSFRLPMEEKLPYRIAVKSELNNRWLQASYLFAPTVVLLDEAFQPIHSEDINLCEYMGWTNESSGAFGSISVSSPQARYLVVYSSQKQQSSDTYWEQSPASFSAQAPVNMSPAGSFKIPHGPDGTIWIGRMDRTYRNAIDHAVCGKPSEGKGVLDTLRGLPGHLLGNGS